MRPQAQRVVFFLFHVDPVGDEVVVEDVAAQQEGMIGLERFDRAAKRIGHAGDLGEFFRRQFVKIFVERIAGIDAVLDSIETGEKHRGEGEIRIRRRIGRAELDPFRFRTRRIGRNSNRSGTIARGIGEIDRRFESGDEPLVAVGGRIRQAGERRRMFQNSADEKERHLAQAGVTVAGKERFVVFPKRHVRVHAASRCRQRAVSA